jgi:hypothetical protein
MVEEAATAAAEEVDKADDGLLDAMVLHHS